MPEVPEEQGLAPATPRPFGYRVVLTDIPADEKPRQSGLLVPMHAATTMIERGVVVDQGQHSELDPGTVVFYTGSAIEINGYKVIEMSQIVATEDP